MTDWGGGVAEDDTKKEKYCGIIFHLTKPDKWIFCYQLAPVLVYFI